MKILFVNSSAGEDYLCDLLLSAFVCHSRTEHDLYFNYFPDYLFDDFPDPHSLYGLGYTAFCSVPSFLRPFVYSKTITETDILDISASTSPFDLVIYTSIWRTDSFLSHFLSSLPSLKLFVVDGEDHDRIHLIASMPGIYYFKRELKPEFSAPNIYPIDFKFPEYHLPFILDSSTDSSTFFVPKKTTILAPCDPRYRASYLFRDQTLYYSQYASAMFGVTTCKGGWDCMRHYEILANHCLPFFPDISQKPSLTMDNYPVNLQLEINDFFKSIIYSSQPFTSDNMTTYKSYLFSFLDIFYRNMLASSYAGHLFRYI